MNINNVVSLETVCYVYIILSTECTVIECDVPLTCTLGSLTEYPVHHLTAHVTEGGAQEVVDFEPMGHVYLESLSEELRIIMQRMKRKSHMIAET